MSNGSLKGNKYYICPKLKVIVDLNILFIFVRTAMQRTVYKSKLFI